MSHHCPAIVVVAAESLSCSVSAKLAWHLNCSPCSFHELPRRKFQQTILTFVGSFWPIPRTDGCYHGNVFYHANWFQCTAVMRRNAHIILQLTAVSLIVIEKTIQLICDHRTTLLLPADKKPSHMVQWQSEHQQDQMTCIKYRCYCKEATKVWKLWCDIKMLVW